MAKLSLKTQGVKGNSPKWTGKLGYTANFVGGEMTNNIIIIDAFEGIGKDYKERKECNIEIHSKGNVIFNGTFEELVNKISKK